jgi:hypothetical protein
VACLAPARIQSRTSQPRTVEIRKEPHRLNQESVEGYRLLLGELPALSFYRNAAAQADLIIAPAAIGVTAIEAKNLGMRVLRGATLIFESALGFCEPRDTVEQRGMLNDIFALGIGKPVSVDPTERASGLQVNYCWPLQRSTRTFESLTPVDCRESEAIALIGGEPVCLAKKWGKGTLVYLGSMLGPALFAEEREAKAIGAALLTSSFAPQ